MTMTITLIIIIITVLISFTAFSNEKLYDDLIFYPPAVTYRKQWYRFITCGFIHADLPHLIFNMISFFMFGKLVEESFVLIFQEKGKLMYLLLYVTALFACLLPTYAKHKDDAGYRSLGASGAVSAVIFAYILLNPLDKMGLLILPDNFTIPGFVFGILYLVTSSYLDKRGGGNINHSAHIWGALYGIAFVIFTTYVFTDYRVMDQLIHRVQYYINGLR
jgi:membrane associated rhomboid family serine protease